ncbi:MAG: DUF934 domain-containing protein [Pseudomonadota bacterium]
MLLDKSGEIEDHWPLIADSDELPDQGYALVPLARLDEAIEHDRVYLGARMPNDAEPRDLIHYFGRLGLISVDFPSFADGRGFSIAARLRDLGFTGRMRAEGPVIADQFGYLLACGYDEVAVPDDVAVRQPADQWISQLSRVSLAYQRGRTGRTSVLDQRLSAGH